MKEQKPPEPIEVMAVEVIPDAPTLLPTIKYRGCVDFAARATAEEKCPQCGVSGRRHRRTL